MLQQLLARINNETLDEVVVMSSNLELYGGLYRFLSSSGHKAEDPFLDNVRATLIVAPSSRTFLRLSSLWGYPVADLFSRHYWLWKVYWYLLSRTWW